jgi:hypothetical protein
MSFISLLLFWRSLCVYICFEMPCTFCGWISILVFIYIFMGYFVYIADITKVLPDSFFQSALAQIYLFLKKRWIMPRHVLVLPIRHFGSCYTHFGSVIDIVMLPIRHFGSCYTHFGSVMNNLRISITHTLWVLLCTFGSAMNILVMPIYTRWVLLCTFWVCKWTFWCCRSHTLGPIMHIFGSVMYLLGVHYKCNMCIIGPKVCNGQHQNVSQYLQTHLIWARKYCLW